MRMSLNPEDLTVDTVVVDPSQGESHADDRLWYTNTEPVQVTDTGCTIA